MPSSPPILDSSSVLLWSIIGVASVLLGEVRVGKERGEAVKHIVGIFPRNFISILKSQNAMLLLAMCSHPWTKTDVRKT